jgi:hypothetical protein
MPLKNGPAAEDNAWMLVAATCTEEKFTWRPPGRIAAVCVSGTWTLIQLPSPALSNTMPEKETSN